MREERVAQAATSQDVSEGEQAPPFTPDMS